MWRRALGNDNLLFQFGLFDETELAAGPTAGSVGQSEVRHFDRQLDLAGLARPVRPRIERILDLGCGWGFLSCCLAERFPEARYVDAINISRRQLEYCADELADSGLKDRVRLYLCDGQDVDLMPDPDIPYDLVVVRGVYTHFLNDVFEASVGAVAERLRLGGLVIISDTLYKGELDTYESAIPDTVDRLASLSSGSSMTWPSCSGLGAAGLPAQMTATLRAAKVVKPAEVADFAIVDMSPIGDMRE
ncbi:class I SAM-dependent methyltransferase [Actinomadura sp. KC06]|uniref:SAM-dependent methyltransferase n=1 Tax=Actinomadura sp. KC06 TaxID=2530369 RepID=UPI001A9F4F34|nr:class I SAM-dependent methyltransferase [Actinomadura sp. KC06]